jgi:hypothetical protein
MRAEVRESVGCWRDLRMSEREGIEVGLLASAFAHLYV